MWTVHTKMYIIVKCLKIDQICKPTQHLCFVGNKRKCDQIDSKCWNLVKNGSKKSIVELATILHGDVKHDANWWLDGQFEIWQRITDIWEISWKINHLRYCVKISYCFCSHIWSILGVYCCILETTQSIMPNFYIMWMCITFHGSDPKMRVPLNKSGYLAVLKFAGLKCVWH